MKYQASEYLSLEQFNQMKQHMTDWKIHTFQFVPSSGLPVKVLWQKEVN